MLLMTGRALSSTKAGDPSGRRSFRRAAVEHVDGGIARARPHATRFGEVGNEECFAAGLGERGRDGLKSHAISIGLDHGRAFDGEGLMRQRAPVRRDGGKIDDQRAAGFGFRQRVGRFGKRFRKCHARVMTAAAAAVKVRPNQLYCPTR
jgi:hypothetical protein